MMLLKVWVGLTHQSLSCFLRGLWGTNTNHIWAHQWYPCTPPRHTPQSLSRHVISESHLLTSAHRSICLPKVCSEKHFPSIKHSWIPHKHCKRQIFTLYLQLTLSCQCQFISVVLRQVFLWWPYILVLFMLVILKVIACLTELAYIASFVQQKGVYSLSVKCCFDSAIVSHWLYPCACYITGNMHRPFSSLHMLMDLTGPSDEIINSTDQ